MREVDWIVSGRTRSRACPVRTCVGCRRRAAKNDLLRIAVVEGVIVLDQRGTLAGRGAYLHPDSGCLDLAARRRAFARAFRQPGPFELTDVRQQMERIAEVR